MKKIAFFAMALAIAVPCTVLAQTQDDARKERKEVVKQSEKKLNAKVSKATKKEAKRLKKEGWQPIGLPLETQLERAYLKQLEETETGYPVYIVGEGKSFGKTFNTAKNAANEVAKNEIVGKMQAQITSLTELSLDNNQLSPNDAVSIDKVLTASKNLVVKRLSRVIELVEFQREKDGGEEVLVRLAYNQKMALEEMKSVMQQELEKEDKDLHEELDKIFDQLFEH